MLWRWSVSFNGSFERHRVLTIKDHSFADDIQTINKLIQTGKIITTVKKRINLI